MRNRAIWAVIPIVMITIMLSGCNVKQIAENLVEAGESLTPVEETKSDDADTESDFFDILDIPDNQVVPDPGQLEGAENNHYYSQITEEQQVTYRQIVTAIQERLSTFYVTSTSGDDIHRSLTAVLADFPEFFWIEGKSTITNINDGESFELELTYNIPEEQIDSTREQIDGYVAAYLSEAAAMASDYDRAKRAFDFIIEQTDYQIDSAQNQNIQSVFLNHVSVCAGYTKAFQYLMKQLQIPCIYVEGNAGNNAEPHAWNQVFLDGQWYSIDCTWGEPNYLNQSGESVAPAETIVYDYFCITTEEMNRSHAPNPEYAYPECTSHDYDYYRLIGAYQDVYTDEGLSAAVWATVNEGGDRTYVKYSTLESLEQAKAAIDGREVIRDAILQKMEWDGLAQFEYSYYVNNNIYILKLMF